MQASHPSTPAWAGNQAKGAAVGTQHDRKVKNLISTHLKSDLQDLQALSEQRADLQKQTSCGRVFMCLLNVLKHFPPGSHGDLKLYFNLFKRCETNFLRRDSGLS